jgi:hypothetical protein
VPRLNEFLGRIAVVTGGAGAAIGGTTCRTLASYGAAVVVLDEHPRGPGRWSTPYRRTTGSPPIRWWLT